jgi:two-component system sensor histidine kinase BaeS
MRTLTVKLTLAFLLIGSIGAVLVAVLVGQRTRSEFDKFVSQRDQPALITALGDYYAAHGSWNGADDALRADPALAYFVRNLVVTNPNGVVVVGRRDVPPGSILPPNLSEAAVPIQSNGQLRGYLLLNGPRPRDDTSRLPPPDQQFIERVQWATAVSAGVAALMALFAGIVLARTLTRPLRELTAATQAMARGTLSQRVEVRSRDEIGELAASFNQMSADLARASQVRKQMTADLAHDLRTPLSILRGYTEGLQDGRLQGSERVYTVMHGEVEHLQRLVEDLRVLSLADAGELPLARRLVDPLALLERTGLAYIVQAEQQGVALRVEADGTLPSISVDTDRMTQVLNNLVSNALRYTSQGTITLRAVAAGDMVELHIGDTGSGIDPEDLPYVFDRFYRADKARQRGGGGESGLGLAISKAIVEAHGGTIVVRSALGSGTTFVITLPAANHEPPRGLDGAHLRNAALVPPVDAAQRRA